MALIGPGGKVDKSIMEAEMAVNDYHNYKATAGVTALSFADWVKSKQNPATDTTKVVAAPDNKNKIVKIISFTALGLAVGYILYRVFK